MLKSFNDGKNLVAFSISDAETEILAENIVSVPIPRASSLIYATDEGIFSLDIKSLEKSTVYSGKATKLVSQNNDLFFLNEDGILCTINTDGEQFKKLSDKAALSVCAYQGAVAYTAQDGIYKCSTDGKFNIKLTDDTNCTINSYEKTLYIKTSDGKIFSLNPMTAEKTAIN